MSTQSEVATRQLALLADVKALESRLARVSQAVNKLTGVAPKTNKKVADGSKPARAPKPSSEQAATSVGAVAAALPSDDDPSQWWDRSTYTPDTDAGVVRLSALCDELGLTRYRFYRVASDYYDWTLEQRRDVLSVPSTTHLCKTVVMTNTHFKPPQTAGNQEHILVIVSYAERLHKEKLANAVYDHYKRLTPPAELLSKRAFDASWRLADNDAAIEMTGYPHNGMTPIGLKTFLLMVMSGTITRLAGGSFCLGGGDVDVKWRVSVKQFVEHFKPIVAEIAMA